MTFSKNWLCPQNYFSSSFWKILWMKNILNLISYKKVTLIFIAGQPLPLKTWTPTNDFSQFFQHKLKNIHEVLLLKSILIWDKILWRINFDLIKFLLNALLLGKLWNECKNSYFLHKVGPHRHTCQVSHLQLWTLILTHQIVKLKRQQRNLSH